MRFHEVFLGSQHEIWSKQYNGKVSELKALQEPAPKTTKEWPEWVRKYKDAIRKDLNNAICENSLPDTFCHRNDAIESDRHC